VRRPHLLVPGDIVTRGSSGVYRVVDVEPGDKFGIGSRIGVVDVDEPGDVAERFLDLDGATNLRDHHAELFLDEAKFAEASDRWQEQVEASAEERRQERERERRTNPLLMARVDPAFERDSGVPLAADGDFIIPGESVGIVYGLREAGKSMSVIDLACSLATGTPWLGLTDIVTGPTGVLYVQCEGPREQVANRIAAWADDHGTHPGDRLVHSAPSAFDLADPGDADAIISAANSENCTVVIIDTLDAARPTGSNMVDGDVGAIFAKTLPAIVEYGISVILVAHANESDRSLAGLSRQQNHVEWMIHIQLRKGGNRVAILDKQKDVAGKPSVSFHIADSAYLHPVTGRPVGVVRAGQRPVCPPVSEATEPAEGPDIAAAVLEAVRANPGATKRKLRDMLGGRAADKDAALQRLIDTGQVRVEVDGQAHRHYAVPCP
jgi:hypothetical protein